MFASRIFIALASFALALAIPMRQVRQSECNITNQHCCETLVSHNSSSATTMSNAFGIDAFPDSDANLGVQCSPIAGIASSGGQCTGTAVCCSGPQSQNGLINSQCSPISL